MDPNDFVSSDFTCESTHCSIMAPTLPLDILNLVLEKIQWSFDSDKLDMRSLFSPESSFVETKRNLQSFMLVSHAFAILARPYLHHTMHLAFGDIPTRKGEHRALSDLANLLRDHPHIASCVRNLSLCKHDEDILAPQRCHLEDLITVLQLFPNLRNLGLCNIKLTTDLPGSPIDHPLVLGTCQLWAMSGHGFYEAKDIGGLLTILGPVNTLRINGLSQEYFDSWAHFGLPDSLKVQEALYFDPLDRPGKALQYLLSTPTAIARTMTTLTIRFIAREDLDRLLDVIKLVSPGLQVTDLTFMDGAGLDTTVRINSNLVIEPKTMLR